MRCARVPRCAPQDVVRHCTSECHALYHLRQVVKLAQSQVPLLTMGLERPHARDA